MPDAREILERGFLEMRWRCLSLAADLDRIQRAPGGAELLKTDQGLQQLRQAIQILLDDRPDRAEQVQMTFSDTTSPPNRQADDLRAPRSDIGNRQ